MSSGLTVVIDYGLCNVDSMMRALEECGATNVEHTRDPRVVDRADRIVLPGVGSFAAAMRNLAEWKLLDAIGEASDGGEVPFLGACLGMQLMATTGTEGATDGKIKGLGLVEGEVICLAAQNANERIPHIGWNEAHAKQNSVLFANVPADGDFYFVHSYHLRLASMKDEAARTSYCGGFTSAIEADGRPIFGTQFHPEKSQRNGFRVLKNFLSA
jgi:imidazole glycerol-phosphate synthase subunit HisH